MRKQGDSAHGYIVDLVELMVDEVGWVCGGRVSKRHAWVWTAWYTTRMGTWEINTILLQVARTLEFEWMNGNPRR